MGALRIGVEKASVTRRPISADLRPTFFISRLLGIAPFTNDFQLSKLWVAYSIGILGIIVGNSIYALLYVEDMFLGVTPSKMKLCLYKFLICIMGYFSAISVYYAVVQQKKLAEVIEEIDETDLSLNNSGIETNISTTLLKSVVVLRLVLVVIFTVLFVQCKDFKLQYVVPISIIHIFPSAISHFVESQHNTLIRSVQFRLAILTDRVENGKRGVCRQEEMELLVTVYNRLVEVCQLINEMYGHHLLIAVASIFIITTTNADYVVEDLTTIITQWDPNLVPKIIHNGFWASIRLFELWSIIAACETAVEKAKEFSFALYEYMIQEKISSQGKNKKLWLHLILKKEPNFTACGYFFLNYPLIHSVVAAATTYLVILIQFSRGDPKCGENKH